LTDEGFFQLSRPVTGAEAIEAMNRLERLATTSMSGLGAPAVR
jgi:hypothetical protein